MIEVFLARRIITMNPSWPEGTAVAVRDGQILEVGELENFGPWLARDDHRIIDDFADQVIMPGLIDPHLHPLMAAVLLPMQFITALEWKFPWETVPETRDEAAYQQALRHQHAARPQGEVFFTWGYHAHWHGGMSRELLDEIFADRPAVVWQRSFHEVYLNSAMMAHVGIDPEQIRGCLLYTSPSPRD